MALEIFKLVGSIYVDNTEANNSISKTGDEAEKAGSKLGSAIGTAGKWAAGIAAASVAAGAAIVKVAKDEAANLDTIDKGAKRMGITAESYQELSYAAGLCGVEMSTMEKAAKKLEGTDLSLDDALDQIMSIADESERTQAAIDLFGESVAYSMGPLLQEGADSLNSMKQEANDLGLVMSSETVEGGAAMNDMFSKVEQAMSTLKTGLAAEFMPLVSEMLQWILDHMPEIRQTVTQVISIISKAVQALMPVVEASFKIVASLWNTTLKPVLDAILTFINDVFEGNWKRVWTDVGNIFKTVFNGLKEFFRTPINWIIGKLNNFIDSINSIKIPSWVPAVGGKGFNLSHIPQLAEGGVLERGQTGFLEGNGAEAVVPLDQNKKWIASVARDMSEQGIGGGKTEQLLEDILRALQRMDITIDGKALVGAIATDMDSTLGRMSVRKARGAY